MQMCLRNSHRVTIKDVARAAGVSAQTVSRVINNRPDVAEDTRQRVWHQIDELGYQPSALARSLIQQRSFTLGVVTAGLKYIGPSRTLNGIAQGAEAFGYSLLLKELPTFTAQNIRPLLHSLLSHHVDGIIWATAEVGDNRAWVDEVLPDFPIPILFLTMHARSGIHSVSYDNYSGGRLAVQHLIDQGYRRIGHISGPLDWWEARQRLIGWEDTLRESSLPASREHWQEGNWSSASGESAIRNLIKSYPEMDAVFVANDQMALGVLQFACKQGINIPNDLGVIGFDGISESQYFWPPLSTVFQDQNRLGFSAVERIVEIITVFREYGEMIEPKATILQPELIIRDSSSKRKKCAESNSN